MKTEHEMLKQIIDVIGYEDKTIIYRDDFVNKIFQKELMGERFTMDVREIIFTPKFMDKFLDYLENNYTYKKTEDVEKEILYELDNPTLYLYNLLDLG